MVCLELGVSGLLNFKKLKTLQNVILKGLELADGIEPPTC